MVTLVFIRETIFPIEIHRQLIKEYVDGLMRVEHVKNLCTEFKNCGKDICSDDHNRWLSLSWMDVNVAQVEELNLENHWVEI